MELLQQLGCRIWFENSLLKSRIETETSLGEFRGNLSVALSTCLFPKVSAGSLGRNGTSFFPSKHRPVVCCFYPTQCVERLAVARFAGVAENQISRRSPELLAVSADGASHVSAAVLELLVHLRLQDLALSSRDPLMPALRKIAQRQACQQQGLLVGIEMPLEKK